MNSLYLLLPILIPAIAAVAALFLTPRFGRLCEFSSFVAVTAITVVAALLFNREANLIIPFGGFGIELSLRLYHFSSFILLAACVFAYLVTLYSIPYMRDWKTKNQYYAYLLFTLAFANGAVLSNNIIMMLFFWEGLLATLFGMIAIGHKGAFKTAVKAFTIAGVTDLCMMLGIGITVYLSRTTIISDISLPVDNPVAVTAFVLMMIGAISKAGAMPFHSWIPDAAVDAPLPFMALVPAAIEKLLGIYLLARISLNMFQISPASGVSTVMMVIGVVTILLAVLMALIQKDFKRLLSFHAISQVGYMILGIGTALPIGIVGGLFHMINHAIYKSCLFLTGGAVEKQAGTTDLRKLGGLGVKMPLTFAGFLIAAASISGVPPFNGFFSKELVYDGALTRGWIFYACAVLGSFLTAASFLKLGHAAFLGKVSPENQQVREAPKTMLFPIMALAGLCVLFGLYNALPLRHLIQPILGTQMSGLDFSGFHINLLLTAVTLIVLVLAFMNHILGVRLSGSGLGASDHIHHAPIANAIYNQAEKGRLDPYNIGMWFVGMISKIAWGVDRGIDLIYNKLVVGITYLLTTAVSRLHTGSHSMYVAWSFIGIVLVVIAVMGGL